MPRIEQAQPDPICPGCVLFQDGQCRHLANFTASFPGRVVEECGAFDPIPEAPSDDSHDAPAPEQAGA